VMASSNGTHTGKRTLLRIADVRFSQASIFPTLTNGTSLAEFFQTLVLSGWNEEFEPPRVVRVQARSGPIFVAFDNRRSVALRWMLEAGMKDSTYFLVFNAEDKLVDEVRSADIGLRFAKFGVAVGEEALQALAASQELPLERLASRRCFRPGDVPETWGDVLLARTSAQRLWGAPDFPLLGLVELPWVKWDIMAPYTEHCRRLRELPKDHPIVHFRQPRCMFDRRSKASLVEFLQTIPGEDEDVRVADGVPQFSAEWRRFLEHLHRWCDDVLEGRVRCGGYAWRPASIRLASVADGRARIERAELAFQAARVDLLASLVHDGGGRAELVVPLVERGFEGTAAGREEPMPDAVACSQAADRREAEGLPGSLRAVQC